MKLYKTANGYLVEDGERFYQSDDLGWDSLLCRDDLYEHLKRISPALPQTDASALSGLRAPIGSQEVWAAGVTYFRSRDARMEESKSAGGGDFYDRVYSANRPELFFKATAHRVVGSGGKVAIRSDAAWSVPEPELTLLVTPAGKITGYTIGNDMSSRDIEGENPLYLPQAKVYTRCCGLGPGILISAEELPASTGIEMTILRAGNAVFTGATTIASLKRKPASLVEYLYRDNSFPSGCFLLTGTGIVPPDEFTLRADDEIRITIPPIGTLVNYVG